MKEKFQKKREKNSQKKDKDSRREGLKIEKSRAKSFTLNATFLFTSLHRSAD